MTHDADRFAEIMLMSMGAEAMARPVKVHSAGRISAAHGLQSAQVRQHGLIASALQQAWVLKLATTHQLR